jgi:hypothetical protein
MDKNQGKIEIEKLKSRLGQLKELHKRANENHKYQLDGLKKDVAKQTTPSAKQNAKLRVESKKQSWDSAKKAQAREIEQIMNQIQRIKNSI